MRGSEERSTNCGGSSDLRRLNPLTRAVLIVALALATALAGAFAVRARCEEIEVIPDWRAGHLAIYLLSFPGEGSTIHGSVHISLAVWNADPDDPIRILLDGEETALIDREGVFTYSWKLRGSHHLAIVCRYKIFDEASFWANPPSPLPPMMPVSEFLAKMEEQKGRMILFGVMATAAGVPSGIWIKKKTKIRSSWAFLLPGGIMVLGYWRMPDLYMLLPFGIACGLTYWLARDYADVLGLMWVRRHGITVEELAVDDEGQAIVGISPRYIRQGFILRKNIKIEHEYPCLLTYDGILKCVVVKKKTETKEQIKIECSRALAELLIQEGVLERVNKTVEEIQARNTLLESSATAAMWHKIREEVKARLKGVMEGELGKVGEEE